jgi:CBS-domain-containing membrane protein
MWNLFSKRPFQRRPETLTELPSIDYLDCMLDSRSVRHAALETSVTSATSFRWRHRFLGLSKDDRRARLGGIVEADEMYMLESHKGSRTLARPPRKRGGKATRRGISN